VDGLLHHLVEGPQAAVAADSVDSAAEAQAAAAHRVRSKYLEGDM
jgi:hypothetical protein